MASKTFNDFGLKLGKKQYDLSTDVFTIYFVSNTYGTVDDDVTNPNISGFTPLNGGNIPGAGVDLTGNTWTRTAAVNTLDFTNPSTIAKNASNPANVRVALVAHKVSGDLYKAVDLTGGTDTPPDLVNNDFAYQINASGSATLTRTA